MSASARNTPGTFGDRAGKGQWAGGSLARRELAAARPGEPRGTAEGRPGFILRAGRCLWGSSHSGDVLFTFFPWSFVETGGDEPEACCRRPARDNHGQGSRQISALSRAGLFFLCKHFLINPSKVERTVRSTPHTHL